MVLLLGESPPPLCTLLIRFGLKNRFRTRLRASKILRRVPVRHNECD